MFCRTRSRTRFSPTTSAAPCRAGPTRAAASSRENEEERFSHDIRCRELLNAGRGIVLRTLFRMAEYPRDMIVLYAQGYSITAFLVEKGGGGREGRTKLLQFLEMGMGNDWQPGVPQRYHGTPESWNEACRRVYGAETVDGLEKSWLDALHTPPSRVAAREIGRTGSGSTTPASYASAGVKSGGRTELRTSAPPAMPVLEPPVRAIRAAMPDSEPLRRRCPPSLARTAPAGAPPAGNPAPGKAVSSMSSQIAQRPGFGPGVALSCSRAATAVPSSPAAGVPSESVLV